MLFAPEAEPATTRSTCLPEQRKKRAAGATLHEVFSCVSLLDLDHRSRYPLEQIVEGFKEAGAENAYCGDPARASAEEGRELVERLADMIVGTVRETWPELFE